MLRKDRSNVYRFLFASCNWSILHTIYLNFFSQPRRKMPVMNISLTSFSRAVL